MSMDITQLSLSVALSRENLQSEDPQRFTLYASLIRVGLSISFGALAIFLIVLLVFAPSLMAVPFGETGTTLFGLISSAISYKIYRISKVSNSTVLTAGRDAIGPDNLWRKSTKSAARRVVSSVVALLMAPLVLFLGVKVLETISRSTAPYSEGMLSGIGTVAELPLLVSVFAFNAGTLTISLGCVLVFWSLITPLRSALMRGYRYYRLQSIIRIYRALERISGVSHYEKPEKMCEECFSSSFRLRKNTDGQSEYELVCSRCKRPFAGLQEVEEYKYGDEAIKASHLGETQISIED